jgi:hypothetical protein
MGRGKIRIFNLIIFCWINIKRADGRRFYHKLE